MYKPEVRTESSFFHIDSRDYQRQILLNNNKCKYTIDLDKCNINHYANVEKIEIKAMSFPKVPQEDYIVFKLSNIVGQIDSINSSIKDCSTIVYFDEKDSGLHTPEGTPDGTPDDPDYTTTNDKSDLTARNKYTKMEKKTMHLGGKEFVFNPKENFHKFSIEFSTHNSETVQYSYLEHNKTTNLVYPIFARLREYFMTPLAQNTMKLESYIQSIQKDYKDYIHKFNNIHVPSDPDIDADQYKTDRREELTEQFKGRIQKIVVSMYKCEVDNYINYTVETSPTGKTTYVYGNDPSFSHGTDIQGTVFDLVQESGSGPYNTVTLEGVGEIDLKWINMDGIVENLYNNKSILGSDDSYIISDLGNYSTTDSITNDFSGYVSTLQTILEQSNEILDIYFEDIQKCEGSSHSFLLKLHYTHGNSY